MKDITELFNNIIDDINNIIENDFYDDKGEMSKVREIILVWFDDFKKRGTLKNISRDDLIFADLEISTIFGMYISSESVSDNFCERLTFDFGMLKRYWKDEVVGGK